MWEEKNLFSISSMPDHFREDRKQRRSAETTRDSGKEGMFSGVEMTSSLQRK
jgi:hypothetical protein